MKRAKGLLITSLDDLEHHSLIPKKRISTIGCRLKNDAIIELDAHQEGDSFAIKACFDTDESEERKVFELEHVFSIAAMPTITITHRAFADISSADPDDMMSKIVSTALSRNCKLTLERIKNGHSPDTIRIDICSRGYSSSTDVPLATLADFLETVRLPGEHG